jgi:hypothetical protein
MTVMVEMHNTGDPSLKGDVVASVEHALADRRGDWRVSIIGSQANDRWEMKILGPNAFERSYVLEAIAGSIGRRGFGALSAGWSGRGERRNLGEISR